MPYLQFETSVKLPAEGKCAFVERFTDRYAMEMNTGTGRVAVTIREHSDGRARTNQRWYSTPTGEGRSAEQGRAFAEGVIEEPEVRFRSRRPAST